MEPAQRERLAAALSNCRQRLLAHRHVDGYWPGHLSSSALATAIAVVAFRCVDDRRFQREIEQGLDWLAGHVNADGGWGDSEISQSNLSTTLLAWSAFGIMAEPARYRPLLERVRAWLQSQIGLLEPDFLVRAINDRYGRDRTFSVPILALAAVCGRLGDEPDGFRRVKALPFELAALPQGLWRRLRLPVVSYALPALIALGQLRYRKRPPANPLTRLIRRLAGGKTLEVLAAMQPEGGGFLEAAPLTGFVVMSLAAAGYRQHVVVQKGVEFLARTRRDDGSWPIDTDLATWLTTLSVGALTGGGALSESLDGQARDSLCDWLLGRQMRQRHPYTDAEPGGWAWTHRPGGVPDADDTAGALLALHSLSPHRPDVVLAAAAGIRWLLDLQNRDGGVPTFCRGWSKLPFDRSCPDITAHALAALATWRDQQIGFDDFRREMTRAIRRGSEFLDAAQQADGSWRPLWFGNEHADDQANLTYGTCRVLLLAGRLPAEAAGQIQWPGCLRRAVDWLLNAQNDNGGWGGAAGVAGSIEETALAVEALAAWFERPAAAGQDAVQTAVADALRRGTNWLLEHTRQGQVFPAAPIGLYFARLWYYERLYPLIFTTAAFGRVDRIAQRLWPAD
ncbi:MAG: hypothetical protein JW810_14140 [Sedimentisphaerales bacterium]|nr:hypothetical protein [Sedimentisphaerales bacterium]